MKKQLLPFSYTVEAAYDYENLRVDINGQPLPICEGTTRTTRD